MFSGAAGSQTLNIHRSFAAPAFTQPSAPLYRLPQELKYGVTTTIGSNTVTVVSGPTNFALIPGDWVWTDAFPWGATVETVTGTAYPYTLTMEGVENVSQSLQPVTTLKTYTAGAGKMWEDPCRRSPRARASSWVLKKEYYCRFWSWFGYELQFR